MANSKSRPTATLSSSKTRAARTRSKTVDIEPLGAKLETSSEDRTMPTKAASPVANSIFADLPSPEELAKYEKIVPGGAERLIELAELRVAHRQEAERRALESEIKSSQVRTIIGFVLALSVGLLGGMLLLQGSELAGLILILIDAAALIGITLYERHSLEG